MLMLEAAHCLYLRYLGNSVLASQLIKIMIKRASSGGIPALRVDGGFAAQQGWLLLVCVLSNVSTAQAVLLDLCCCPLTHRYVNIWKISNSFTVFLFFFCFFRAVTT